jgi:hypothetical protein
VHRSRLVADLQWGSRQVCDDDPAVRAAEIDSACQGVLAVDGDGHRLAPALFLFDDRRVDDEVFLLKRVCDPEHRGRAEVRSPDELLAAELVP